MNSSSFRDKLPASLRNNATELAGQMHTKKFHTLLRVDPCEYRQISSQIASWSSQRGDWFDPGSKEMNQSIQWISESLYQCCTSKLSVRQRKPHDLLVLIPTIPRVGAFYLQKTIQKLQDELTACTDRDVKIVVANNDRTQLNTDFTRKLFDLNTL
eukprot:423245-Hanusia_phi.AAC.1